MILKLQERISTFNMFPKLRDRLVFAHSHRDRHQVGLSIYRYRCFAAYLFEGLRRLAATEPANLLAD